MRSQNQIVDRIKGGTEDFFGFAMSVMIEFVERDRRKREDWIKPEEDDIIPFHEPTKENVLMQMKEYLPFAYDKAYMERGLSADRSVTKFTTWLWLLEDDDLYQFACNDENYPMYGRPILDAIRDKYFKDIVSDFDNKKLTCPHCGNSDFMMTSTYNLDAHIQHEHG